MLRREDRQKVTLLISRGNFRLKNFRRSYQLSASIDRFRVGSLRRLGRNQTQKYRRLSFAPGAPAADEAKVKCTVAVTHMACLDVRGLSAQFSGTVKTAHGDAIPATHAFRAGSAALRSRRRVCPIQGRPCRAA